MARSPRRPDARVPIRRRVLCSPDPLAHRTPTAVRSRPHRCTRRAARHRPPPPADADERAARIPDPHTPERILSDFEQRRRLQLAMDELPDEQREVLLLRLEQELSLEEIGEITGVGRETVKSRLRYAMDKLRARMAP